jgi:Undecaprenyl-phosphate glucose phosphotransferase
LLPVFLQLSPLIALLTMYSFHKNGLYQSYRYSSRMKEIISVLKANILSLVLLVILFYFFSSERVSRLTILIYFIVSTSLLVFFRIIFRNILRSLRKNGHNLRHVLLVGNGAPLLQYIDIINQYKDCGVNIVGWIDSHENAEQTGINKIDKDYNEFIQSNTVDSFVISYQGSSSHQTSLFIKEHYNDVIPIKILPDLSYSMVGHSIDDFVGLPTISVNSPKISSISLAVKSFIEIFMTFLGLLIISPLLFTISILVKASSPGPIFFAQERIGLNGKKFKMWKFRSMKVADKTTQTNEWSNKDNPRKTKVGEILRKTSLDELPQLWNVMTGDMSLIGPRPEQPHFVNKFRHEIPGYMLKHKMKPGITGWAQVNGWRGDTDLGKRIECDIYYIKHWSLWFDFKIIFLTFWKGFINKNAY